MKSLHRWLGLAFLLPLLIMGLTGIALVFRGELSDLPAPGPATVVDPGAIGAGLERLESEGLSVSSVWTSGGRADRFHVYATDASGDRTIIIDGQGNRISAPEKGVNTALDLIADIHSNLNFGNAGALIVILSGLALIGLVGLGLLIGWPAKGAAKRALAPPKTASLRAFAFAWHRALGLWLAGFALFVALTGTLLANVDAIKSFAGVKSLSADVPAATQRTASPADILRAAFARYPGARLTMISLPSDEEPYYRVRLNTPGEMRKIYGATTVLFHPASGALLAEHDAGKSNLGEAFVETLYSLHAGYSLGLLGRLAVGLTGLWLVAMIALSAVHFAARKGWRGKA